MTQDTVWHMPPNKEKLLIKNAKKRIFLSYAHEDLDTVRRIDAGLTARNLDVWFDKRCLKPGSWKRQIEKQIPKCRHFVICISNAALKKTGDEPGFQDDELQQAYEIARVQPEDAFTIVPIRLEDCVAGVITGYPHISNMTCSKTSNPNWIK